MFPKRYKAFTLIELLVVMLVTTLFSILAFYGYQLIQQQYLVYKRQNEKMEIYQRFSALLFRDVSAAKVVEIHGRELRLDNTLSYFFQDTLVQRIQQSTNYQETFPVKTLTQRFSFEKKSVNNSLIDYGEIAIDFFHQSQTLTLTKAYSAYDLLNYQQ